MDPNISDPLILVRILRLLYGSWDSNVDRGIPVWIIDFSVDPIIPMWDLESICEFWDSMVNFRTDPFLPLIQCGFFDCSMDPEIPVLILEFQYGS